MTNPYSNVYGPGVTRFATDWAQWQDEFTRDAESFGIDVPPTYGCISGCKVCRDFRNLVRDARVAYLNAWKREIASWDEPTQYDLKGNPPCGGDWDCDGTCRIDPPVADKPVDTFDRIANALELIADRLPL